jgi:3-oxoacyl-[acyl-carrier protein] reductase
MRSLTGKVAVVMGASKGIGAEISRALARAGASVAVNYATSKEGADRVVADITGKGGKAISVKGDVANADDVKAIFAETKKAFGSLDILVNNAGVYAFQPLESITESEFIGISTSTCWALFSPRRKRSSTSALRAAASSISVPLRA